MSETLAVYRLDPEGKVVVYPFSKKFFVGPYVTPYGDSFQKTVCQLIRLEFPQDSTKVAQSD